MPLPPEAAKKIREKLDLCLLPRDGPVKMWAGHGKGEPCDGCDALILPAQVVWEFDAGDERVVRFHPDCAALWEAERRRRGWSKPAA